MVQPVADAYSFGKLFHRGRGRRAGLILATVLARNPHLKGTLYEVPHLRAGAKTDASAGEWNAGTLAVQVTCYLRSRGRRRVTS